MFSSLANIFPCVLHLSLALSLYLLQSINTTLNKDNNRNGSMAQNSWKQIRKNKAIVDFPLRIAHTVTSQQVNPPQCVCCEVVWAIEKTAKGVEEECFMERRAPAPLAVGVNIPVLQGYHDVCSAIVPSLDFEKRTDSHFR
jgi:hypothetical protein